MAKDILEECDRFNELCSDLNLDPSTKEEALKEFYRIKENYTLEGDQLHWLACALYEACRRKTVPTIDNGEMQGNCVSLTRLLRTANLSLILFFNKVKKWADMANLPESFRERIERLERNFSVSKVIYDKYRPIFVNIFIDPLSEPPKAPRSRKQRPKPCTSTEVYDFIWKMFILTKGNFPNISDDLVNSYHLLLCVIDWVYINAILSNRQDLLCEGLPAANTSQCIISKLCKEHDGIEIEAKGIKEHYFKDYIQKLAERRILQGNLTTDNLLSVLDVNIFEENIKAIDKTYEEFVLTIGDFDERIFLSKAADAEIGTPAKHSHSMPHNESSAIAPPTMLKSKPHETIAPKIFCPKTPLTGRHHLPDSVSEVNATPVSAATLGVTKLHNLLSGRKKDILSDNLLKMFSECSENPKASIESRVQLLGEKFCKAFTMPCNQIPASHSDFAQKRLQFAVMLYYKVLESIMIEETKKLEKRATGKPVDLTGLLEQDVFHKSLFACCIEVVIFCYNSQRTFPWILAVFELQPYDFYKVIELLIRAEDGFSRDIIKHLNCIEESILDCLAWKSDSPLWTSIHNMMNSGEILPKSEEVSFQQQNGYQINAQQRPLGSPLSSPITHPQVTRLAKSDGKMITKKQQEISVYSPGHSPSRAPLASERFSSPVTTSARRRLFPANTVIAADGHSPAVKQQIITIQQAVTGDGKQVLIPVQIVQNIQHLGTTPTGQGSEGNGTTSGSAKTSTNSKKRTGSLGLFFRKVYHLASVRLRHLCDSLGADDQLRRRIWTTFENCLVYEIELMKDRHLDQFIMCAMYAICKISGQNHSFQDIMRCYRLQPQAQSHVYRSVLLAKLASQSQSQSAESNSSQLSEDSDSSERIQDRLNNLRSSSTLPSSQSGSAPPTPTRVSGSSSAVYDDEERGDLIKFYNMVYVKNMKQFILRFQGKDNSDVNLSALPITKPLPTSPRRVSNHHSIFVSPHKKQSAGLSLLTPNSRLLYCFNSSPAKDLRAINNMIRMDERRTTSALGDKRLGTSEVIEGGPAIKHIKF